MAAAKTISINAKVHGSVYLTLEVNQKHWFNCFNSAVVT